MNIIKFPREMHSRFAVKYPCFYVNVLIKNAQSCRRDFFI